MLGPPLPEPPKPEAPTASVRLVLPQRFTATDIVTLFVAMAVAATLRVLYLTTFAAAGESAGPLRVQDAPRAVPAYAVAVDEANPRDSVNELDELAANLVRDGTFRAHAPFAAQAEPTAHLAPLYPAFLALLESRLSWPKRDCWARWVNMVLGTLTVGLCYLLARRAFASRAAGVLTAYAAALHPGWIVQTADVSDGVLTGFLLTLGLVQFIYAHERGGLVKSVLVGLTLGLVMLARGSLWPMVLVSVVWYAIRCGREFRQGWLYGLLMLLGVLVTFLPWTIRNTRAVQTFQPIVDSGAYHLWVGNNPQATGGSLDESRLLTIYAQQVGKELDEARKELADLSQVRRYSKLEELAWQEIAARPSQAIQRRAVATLGFFTGHDWLAHERLWHGTIEPPEPGQEESALHAAGRAVYAGYFIAFTWLLLGLALLGWRWSFAYRNESAPLGLAMLTVPLPVMLTHATALPTHRLPLDGVLLAFGAFAVLWLFPLTGLHLRARAAGELVEGDDE